MSNEKPSESANQNLNRLLQIMTRLRGPNGCPWDQKQTMASLTRYTVEEAYEVADAIAGGEPDNIREELGDLLFQIVFYSELAQEKGWFTFEDVAADIADKMVRRHPHVFENHQVDESALSQQWEAIKASEKRLAQDADKKSIFDAVPSGLPALMYAQKLQKVCARVGFDWTSTAPVIDKVREEVEEINVEITTQSPDQARIEEEIGDALFAMVNLSRHCNVDADTALRRASRKFTRRFEQIEHQVLEQGLALEDMSLTELESIWQRVKSVEKSGE